MERIGVILSQASTDAASCQLLESAEKGEVHEGMLVKVKRTKPPTDILARVGEVIPYNEFYTQGDAWSESRRKGLRIPEDVARRWEVCRLDLLRDLRPGSMSITFPPAPGDPVYGLDPSSDKKEIFEVDEEDPGIISLGALKGYGEQMTLPLKIEELPMHLAIFGVTGSGKSFTNGVLIERLLKIKMTDDRDVSYPLVIVDAHGDYVNYAERFQSRDKTPAEEALFLGSAASWFRRFVFPKQALGTMGRDDSIQPVGINLQNLSPGEVAQLVIEFYKGETSGSVLQLAGLSRVLDDLRDKGYNMNTLFTDISILEREIDEVSSNIIHSASKGAVYRAIRHFNEILEQKHLLLSTRSPMKEASFIDELTRERGVAILDFSADGAPGADLPTKQFVMTYLAKALYRRFSEYKSKGSTRYLLFMIEEAQNFCPSNTYSVGASMSHSTLQAIATQGRKFGLSLCLVSQRPSFLDEVVVSMCNSFIIHRVSPDDASFVKKVTGGLPGSLASRLTNLGLGEAIVHGQFTPVPFPMLIWIPKKQRTIAHVTGTTNVVKGIAEASDLEV